MALIYRAILEIEDDDGGFVDRAPAHVLDWFRFKFRDDPLPGLSLDDSTALEPYGIELSATSGANDECSVLRVSAYEGARDDGTEVKTTLTAIREDQASWAWVDLERWTRDDHAAAWIPSPPGIVATLLRQESVSRGGLTLGWRPVSVYGDEGGLIVDLVLDERRQIPLVVVSYNERESEGLALAEERGRALARRLAGVASVFVLGQGAVTAFSKAMHAAAGPGMDVHSGAIRTYLPGAAAENDFPGRHRFVVFRKIEGRRPDLASLVVAPPLLRRAVETPPPPIWRSSARSLLIGHAPDTEYEELLAIADSEILDLRSNEAGLVEQLASERAENTELQRRNDDLGRRLTFLRDRLRALEPGALAEEPSEPGFQPLLCLEVLHEARERLPMIEIPNDVDEGAAALDDHGDESWAGRAWSALLALNRYAEMKRDREFDGSFLTYCENAAGDLLIPSGWVVPTESAQTRENRRFRALRTLPVSIDVAGAGLTFMPEHIRIEKGGTPSPRIHYYDDTRGASGRIHVGWFGDHLDSRAKS